MRKGEVASLRDGITELTDALAWALKHTSDPSAPTGGTVQEMLDYEYAEWEAKTILKKYLGPVCTGPRTPARRT